MPTETLKQRLDRNKQPVETVAGTTRTITAADAGKVIVFTSASTVTITVNDLGVGIWVDLRRAGAGACNLTGSGTTLNWSGFTGLTGIAPSGAITLRCTVAGTTDISGAMV